MTQESNSVYGFALPKEKSSALRKKCQADFGMPSSQYMRIVVDAILEGRLTIAKPKNHKDVYND